MKKKYNKTRKKYQACEKAIREAAFRKAIESEKTAPLSETYDPNSISLTVGSYDGPNPSPEGPITNDMDLEASLFEPGNLPRDFVLVRIISCQKWRKKDLALIDLLNHLFSLYRSLNLLT